MECNSGRIITKTRDGKEMYYIRLNLVGTRNGKKTYRTKDIPTGLDAKRKLRSFDLIPLFINLCTFSVHHFDIISRNYP